VRAATAKALGQIRSEETIPALIGLLADADDEVRLQAIEAIGKIGSRYALT
jgi:HEAT repeat protein